MNRETWLLWLLADSQLPTGGFVASAGLEAAMQAGLVHENALDTDRDSFVEFIRRSTQNQVRFALPFCSQAYEQISEQTILHRFSAVDDHHHAMVSSNSVAMRASVAQGGGLLSLFNRGYAQATFMADSRGQLCVAVAKRLQRLSRLGKIHAHWPTVFGFVCVALGIGLEHAQQLYMFQFVRQIFSAAIRLNLVGPLRAQALECDMQQLVDTLLARYAHLRVAFETMDDMLGESAVYTEPILELFQGMHDRLYSRIFNS
ncbi:hypothetical protein COEREDRAFT_50225 [Coemansia reversa NRRL 1564]|uniref:Urease accessory protein UreF n=1 Tax=Coemansia reversa (strain ATCC 12441 / NRRL 1564) TaxID=763665 RepID=A0A2G5B1R5_COERN|nr:hypothetical protein COEREDRAFT_50225 [Coemansia reversa NRRL 1564]|eukprot:PIA12936.1 hypothetical protein COEREDRAFT_50225 [Coemansia reversa NRRL 1564]